MAGPFAANPRRVLALVVGVAVVTGLAGWLVGTQVQSPADAAAAHKPPAASLVTVPVERRALTSTVVAQGTVGYGNPTPLILTGSVGPTSTDSTTSTAAGTQLVTKAPTAGATLTAGDVLMEVSGRPVFVLPGTVPMYRTLTPGASGDDVKQLQKALVGLGYASKLTSGRFDDATATAVQHWYTHAGYQAEQPTSDQRKQLRTLQQAVTTAQDALSTAQAATGPQQSQQVAQAQQGLQDARANLSDFQKSYGTTVPSGEIIFVPKLPVRLDSVTAKAGAAATGQVGTVTDATIVVQATLPGGDAQLLHTGLPATLTTTDGTTVPATVQALGADAAPPTSSGGTTQTSGAAGSSGGQSGTGSGAGAALSGNGSAAPSGSGQADAGSTPLRLAPNDSAALARYSGQAVKVTVEVGTTGGDVLVVPVAAVVTGADGHARVRVQAGNGQVRDVPVTLGLTALGLVRVTPTGGTLAAGDRVVVGTS